MILKENLYQVVSQHISDNKADFRIALNAENFIYRAHFPGNPITPGVCLVQMVVELFSALRGADFGIKTLRNVKFTAPISPLEFPQIDVLLDCAGEQIKAIVKEKETVFVKMSLVVCRECANK